MSISFAADPETGRRFYIGPEARDVLRSRFGDDVVVSAGSTCIFLYTERAEAASEADLAARNVLLEQGLNADIRLDRWDPSDQIWRDAQTGEPEPDADMGSAEGVPVPGETVKMLASIVEIIVG